MLKASPVRGRCGGGINKEAKKQTFPNPFLLRRGLKLARFFLLLHCLFLVLLVDALCGSTLPLRCDKY
jgi:hypothetical protein